MNQPLERYQPPHDGAIDFWDRVGIPARGPRLHEVLHNGIPYAVFQRLARETHLEYKTLAEYIAIPPATLRRRGKAGRFNTEESDRLYRFASVLEATLNLFEDDADAAHRWLFHPVRGLGGKRPVDMVTTSGEAGAVLNLIGRLEHGVPA